MDKLIKDIDQVVDLLNVLKSRYFFLRSKYDIGNVYCLTSKNVIYFL